jgi:DUF4097 and DUF4098 domain-containing protein YvlB
VDEHTLETVMTQHHFETHEPVALYVEIGKGAVRVTATETSQTDVEITGRDAEHVQVEQSGRQISIIVPRQRAGFFNGDAGLDIAVTLPTGSDVASKTGSADVSVVGTIADCQIKSGSGSVSLDQVSGPCVVETGSGDVLLETAGGGLRIKSGSGDVTVRHSQETVSVSTGSGDVEIGSNNGPAAVKTGSGDLRVVDAETDVSMVSGSGDLIVGTAHRGKFTIKGASSDVQIGIPSGTPVWTDLSTVSGAIHSNLEGVGQPDEGAEHVELRAKTVSGDIILRQV